MAIANFFFSSLVSRRTAVTWQEMQQCLTFQPSQSRKFMSDVKFIPWFSPQDVLSKLPSSSPLKIQPSLQTTLVPSDGSSVQLFQTLSTEKTECAQFTCYVIKLLSQQHWRLLEISPENVHVPCTFLTGTSR